MLRIKVITGGGSAAARYYNPENENRPDEYYGREAELRPVWWSPEETFGVKDGAEAEAAEVKLAFEGRDPAGSGATLTQAQRPRPVIGKNGKPVLGRDGKPKLQGRRAAYDLTMSLPKSVGVILAAAPRDVRQAILADVRASAVGALDAMQARGGFTANRGKAGAGRAPAADVLALVAIHQSDRDGMPHAHVHGVVLNFGRRADGSTAALNDRDMHLMAAEAGALFRAGVAAALERRGFGIQRVPGVEGQSAASFRVAGVAPALEKEFTTRGERMERYIVAKYGAVSAKPRQRSRQMAEAARATRGNKARVPVGADLEARWRATMARQGTSPERVWREALAAARGIRRPSMSAAEAVALRTMREGGKAPKASTLRLRVAIEAQYRGIGVAGARAEMARMERDGWQQVAREAAAREVAAPDVRAALDRERRMILDAVERREEAGPLRLDAAERAISSRPGLSDEQAAAVRHVAGRGGVVAVEGLAGTGKSFMLGAVADAARESGARVVALAPSWQAAEVLAKDTGGPARALQGYVRELARGDARLTARDVVVVDEASMASVDDVSKLLRHAREAGAKVALVGDRRQLRSVEPGAAFAAIADTIGVARMEEVRRQEQPWQREASVTFGNGNSAEGLARYDAQGRIAYVDGAEAALQRVVEAVEQNRAEHPDASRLVLASRNAEVHALNLALRERAMGRGELGAEAVTLRTRHSGGRDGEGIMREMEVRAGDRVSLGWRVDARGILPGDTGTVRAVGGGGGDPVLRVRLDRTGAEVAFRPSELAPQPRKGQPQPTELEAAPVLQHAYARTIHKAQGATCDFAFVHAGEGLDARRAYVAATRHRRDVLIVADAAAVRERLAADGRNTDAQAVRASFLRAASRTEASGNACDFIQDRAAWLATGDPLAVSAHGVRATAAQNAAAPVEEPPVIAESIISRSASMAHDPPPWAQAAALSDHGMADRLAAVEARVAAEKAQRMAQRAEAAPAPAPSAAPAPAPAAVHAPSADTDPDAEKRKPKEEPQRPGKRPWWGELAEAGVAALNRAEARNMAERVAAKAEALMAAEQAGKPIGADPPQWDAGTPPWAKAIEGAAEVLAPHVTQRAVLEAAHEVVAEMKAEAAAAAEVGGPAPLAGAEAPVAEAAAPAAEAAAPSPEAGLAAAGQGLASAAGNAVSQAMTSAMNEAAAPSPQPSPSPSPSPSP